MWDFLLLSPTDESAISLSLVLKQQRQRVVTLPVHDLHARAIPRGLNEFAWPRLP